MKTWLKKLFFSKEIKELRQTIDNLEIKLSERQEAINRTNAYWKKKFSEHQKKSQKL